MIWSEEEDNSGADPQTYCGCVPVAVAQLMKYWDFPQNGAGTRTYNDSGETRTNDFCSPDLNWTNMPNTLPSSQAPSDVSNFIADVGFSLSTDFDDEYSGTYSNNILESLVYHWRYDRAMKSDNIINPPVGWRTTEVVSELNANRPCLYTAAQSVGGVYTSGHAWVVDGYGYGSDIDGNGDNTLYMHFNIGWSDLSVTGWYLDGGSSWLQAINNDL